MTFESVEGTSYTCPNCPGILAKEHETLVGLVCPQCGAVVQPVDQFMAYFTLPGSRRQLRFCRLSHVKP